MCKCNKRRFRRNLPYDRSRIRPGPGRGTPCAPPKDRQIKCAWHASTSIAPMDPAPNVAVSLTSPWPEPRRRLRGVQHAAGPTATTHAMCIQSDCVRVEVLDLHASAPHLILSGSGVTYRHRQQKSAPHKRWDPHRGYRSHPPLLSTPRWWLCPRSVRIWEICG